MKTKKFFMTSLLVMGMIIAKAANGFPPELVLVSPPVLTYNTNSVTVYYDLQNIGDHSYKGDIYIYLDPDNGYYYAKQYVRICSGRIKRVAVTIPAYRPNPSWTYTVMPYYELGDELYSFTTFEYFEPVRFCWHGYHNEPWVVIHVHARPRHYHRPGEYRYYYDGYRPMMPPPPPGGPGYAVTPPPGGPGMPLMNPMHHTYGYHHNNGGYPANHHPATPTPGYNHFMPDEPQTNHGGNPGGNPGGHNSNNEATVAPHGSNTPGSMSSNSAGNNNNNTTTNNGGATTRPGTNVNNGTNTGTNNSGATTRPNGNTTNNGGRTDNNGGRTDNNSGNVSRPNNNTGNTGNSGRTGNTGNSGRTDNNSGNVSRPSNNNTNNSGTNNNGGRVNNGSSRGNNTNNSGTNTRGNNSNSSSRGNNNSNSSSRGGNNNPSRSR